MALRWMLLSLVLTTPVHAQRTAVQQVVSDSLPRIRVGVDTSLGFLGRVQFPVGTTAAAEQFIYGEVRDGRLQRAVIVHFEHFLPSNDSRFVYPSAPADSLGSHSYLHQHWWLGPDFFASGAKALLDRRGISTDTAYVADRHVRAVDEAGKHEVIIFYLEGANTFSSPAGRIPPSMVGNVPPAVARAVAERARRSFQVLE
jgi:hypothetical protein